MFNSRPRRTFGSMEIMEMKDGCDDVMFFFFHGEDDIYHFSPENFLENLGMSGWMSQFSRCAIFPVGQAGLYPFLTCPSPN